MDFYRRFFGEPKKLKADYAKFVGADPEIHLALQPGRVAVGAAGALSHLGIRVDSFDAGPALEERSRRARPAGRRRRSARPAATRCRTSSG